MTRTQCPNCNARTALADYGDGNYCHACHEKTFTKDLFQAPKKTNMKNVPEKDTNEFPLEARQYLKQYYISNWQFHFHKLYWSNKEQRIIVPCSRTNIKAAWGRSLKQQPKWLRYGNKEELFYPERIKEVDELVLVEDVISAIRVSAFKDTLSLCGTSIKDNMTDIILKHKKIIVWLDGDIAGIKGAEKIKRDFRLYKDIRIITTKSDPKTYPDKQIQEILNES